VTSSWNAVTGARAVEVPKAAPRIAGGFELAVEPRAAVGANIALVAGWGRPAGPPVVITIGGAPRQRRYVDKAIIRRRIKLDQARLRYCYARELLRDPKLAGTVDVQAVIDTHGAVVQADVSGTLKDPTVTGCILGIARQWTFPAHDEGTIVVNYPLTFRVAD
jgi:hypothetical protein